MEEQTVQQTTQQSVSSQPEPDTISSQSEPSTAWDDAADGAAYTGYDSEPDMAGTETPDTVYGNDVDNNAPDGELAPDGIGLDEYGDLKLGDNFFKNIPNDPEDSDLPGSKQNPETPNYYTDDELRATPYENWDMKRVGGDVGRYAQEVQRQIQQRQTAARAQAMQNIPIPSDITEVKPYTPKELSEEAKKLAIEKLGLEDPEDFDDYESEHRAAMSLAMNELMNKRNAEVSDYQRGQSEWGQLQKFNADLSQMPDFNDFNQWYRGKLNEAGVTAEQVNAGLYSFARQNGNRFSLIPQIIGSWYTEYQRERGAGGQRSANGQYPRYDTQSARYPQYGTSANNPNRNGYNRKARPQRPPLLESSQGGNYEGRRAVNLRDFGDMDDEDQAAALIKMGLV